MSLINKALKLEQQRRDVHTGPVAPMVSRLQYQRSRDRFPLILASLVGLGGVTAICLTAVFFINGTKSGPSEAKSQLAVAVAPSGKPNSDSLDREQVAVETILTTLSEKELSTVRALLLERSVKSDGVRIDDTEDFESTQLEVEAQQAASIDLAEVSRVQEIVDQMSFQGIRKAGQNTRFFLDGKIRSIGDLVDIENQITIVGFTETDLIFENAAGLTFKKAI